MTPPFSAIESKWEAPQAATPDRSAFDHDRLEGMIAKQPDVDQKVNGCLLDDAATRTDQSFDAAVTNIAEFGHSNPHWMFAKLKLQMDAVGDTDTIQKFRQTAILSAAIGENALYGGTALDLTKPGDGINIGKNLDLGCQAAQFMKLSLDSLTAAKQWASANMGEKVSGTTIDAAYVKQLETSRAHAEARLATVYGDHEILGAKGAFAKVRAGMDANNEGFAKLYLRTDQMARHLAGDGTIKDADMLGKASRDLALLGFAMADRHMDMGDAVSAQTAYSRAMTMIAVSEKVTPSQAVNDIKAFKQIAEQLRQRGLK